MNRNAENKITEKASEEEILLFRRPIPRDDTDRMGREIVRRLMEAGVVEV